MAGKNELKESYDVESKNGAFYMGGKIRWSEDGKTIVCGAVDVVNILDVPTGRVRATLGVPADQVTDPVLTFTADRQCETVISAHKSGLFKMWNVADGTVTKSWRSIHRGPICELALDEKAEILASGATDGVIRLWDLTHQSCTHALRGCQGVISVLEFSRVKNKKRVFACGDDLKIRCWDAVTGRVIVELAGHFSKITALALSDDDNDVLISCARDKVIMVWDLSTGISTKTVPVYETLEGVLIMPKGWNVPGLNKKSDALYAAVAGDKGVIRVFDVTSGKEVYAQTDSKASPAADGGLSVMQLLLNTATSRIAMVTADQNIILHRVDDFKCDKQLVGFADEILDVCFVGPKNSHVALATNSADIKLYKMADMGCQLLQGHSDFALTLACSPVDPCLLLSGGKDSSVRLWRLSPDENTFHEVASSTRHTASVTSVRFFSLSADTFLSVSVDTTLKLWQREKDGIVVARTEVAHDKEINCVSVAPNDALAATASQDKTIKLWKLPQLKLVGVLSGHRRGVWSVRFSPVDQILMSSSADCTIKLWSVADLRCLKTFEGHESSVMRAEYLSRGMQVLSCSGDGLLKLWSIKSSECMATFEGHSGKVWALDVTENEDRIVTGGSDSLMLIWRDTTQEKKLAEMEAREALLLQEQQLNNLINAERLLDALVLALSLDRPFKVLNIIKDVINKEQKVGLVDTISQLSTEQKERLLKCAAAWNCNAKHSAAAQLVISILLDQIATGSLTLTDLPTYLQEVLPYTERHFKRVSQALQELQILQYTIRKINPAMASLG